MKVDILNIEATSKAENLQEVTNPIYFVKDNIPTEDGLFSYKIFGRPGSKERESNFAYINLKKRFIHPMVFDLLKNLGNAFENIMLSKKFYKLNDTNELEEDSENGETGIDFLYKNWNKIYIKETGTKSRTKKMALKDEIKLNEAFIYKMIVAPASIRDFNPNSSSGGKSNSSDEVNRMYSKLLMLTNSLTGYDMGMSISNMITESSIQSLINDIYVYFIEKMAHKNGHIHQAMLSKTVDYSTRSVISAPNFSSNDYTKQEVPFGYAGVPLTQLVVLFYPFYVNFIQNFMIQHEMDTRIIHYKNKKVEDVTNNISLKDIFDEDLIKNLLNLFVRTEQYRFQRIRIENNKGQTFQLEMFKEELGRDFTLMDLVFLATDEIITDKHVYLTRYPIESRRMTCCSINLCLYFLIY